MSNPSGAYIHIKCDQLPLVMGGANHSSFWRRGLHLKFDNGYMVSVVYGRGAYCDCKETYDAEAPCKDMEVAIFDPNMNFVPFLDGQDCKGHVTPNKLAEIIHWAANKEKKND
jgi:hypothetical protein